MMEEDDSVVREDTQVLLPDTLAERSKKYSTLVFTEDEIYINLKVISKLKPNDKITRQGNLINIAPKYLQGITRWIFHESRMDNIFFMERLIQSAFDLNTKILLDTTSPENPNPSVESRNHAILRLTTELDRSIEGLQNMKQTYAHDVLVECLLDFIIDQIKIRVTNNSKLVQVPWP